jgi:hypothetical protein
MTLAETRQDAKTFDKVPKPPLPPPPIVKTGMSQEVLNLDEGPVTLTVPATLSEASYADLADQFELFLRRAKRRVTNKERRGRQPSTPKNQSPAVSDAGL